MGVAVVAALGKMTGDLVMWKKRRIGIRSMRRQTWMGWQSLAWTRRFGVEV
jgi:hypothetical protein